MEVVLFKNWLKFFKFALIDICFLMSTIIFRIMHLIEGGFIQRWSREFMVGSGSVASKSELAAKAFTLQDMAGSFIILGAGVGAGFLMLMAELFIMRKLDQGITKLLKDSAFTNIKSRVF